MFFILSNDIVRERLGMSRGFGLRAPSEKIRGGLATGFSLCYAHLPRNIILNLDKFVKKILLERSRILNITPI